VEGSITQPSTLVADQIRILPGAFFTAPIRYWQPAGPLQVNDPRQARQLIFDEALASRLTMSRRIVTGATMVGFLSATLIALLFLILVTASQSTLWQAAASELRTKPLHAFGAGLLYVLGAPICVLLLFITILGIPFSVLSGVLFGFSLYFSRVSTALVLAHLFVAIRQLQVRRAGTISLALLIFVMLKGISQIPSFGVWFLNGWALNALVILSGLGAIGRARLRALQRSRR
jgi:hypothetical protein